MDIFFISDGFIEKSVENSSLYILHKRTHVTLCRIPAGDKPDFSLPFIPDVKEMMLQQFVCELFWQLEQQNVGFRLLGEGVKAGIYDALAQELGHAVGVPGIAFPDALFKIWDELAADVAHLGTQLRTLLSDIFQVLSQFRTEGNHTLAHHQSVLGAAEA